MVCPTCKKGLIDNSKNCVFCGKILFRKCPVCGKVISVEDKICEFCRTDILLYEKNERSFREAEHLESQYQYEEAKAKYMPIKYPPQLLKQAEKHLKNIDSLLNRISLIRQRANRLLKSGAIDRAYKAFSELYTLFPDEDTDHALKLIKKRLGNHVRRKWITVGAIAVIVLVLLWQVYSNVPYVLAIKGLRSLLGSKNLDIKNSAALILGLKGDKTGNPVLKLLSHSDNETKRVYSLAALASLDDNAALGDLRGVLYNGSTPARLAAAWVFVSKKDTTVIPYLEHFVKSSDIDLHIGASVLLFNLGYSNGLQIIDTVLHNSSSDIRLKGLYALYLLGSEGMLRSYTISWLPLVKPLIADNSDDIKLLSASMLRRFSRRLSPQDSITIARILWSGFVKDSKMDVGSNPSLPQLMPFYLLHGLISGSAEEDFTNIKPLASEIRRKCLLTLSKIELENKSISQSLESDLSSSNPWERLYSTLVIFKSNPIRAIWVLRRLIKSRDEIVKLNSCKLAFEFAHK